MVTVIGFQKRKNSKDKVFHILELQGGVEMLKAVNSGKYYAHARKASITSTLNEATCKALIGSTYPGTIKKVECESYTYKVPGTSDTLVLSHNYQYNADSANTEEAVFLGEIG
jgi:hypothetical protein